ncbi:MAG: ABC transporter permease [Cyanothece sp. SIO1E1]|nr:ABC transporter permease [Cyanothece sp. SIO1E1]
MKPSRILVIATNVFREVIRDRVLYLIAIFAILLGLAALLLPEIAAGTEDKIILDLGLAGISLLSLGVVVFVGTGLVNKEIEKRTVLVLLAKPVNRLEFIVGKHLGLSAVIAVLVALMLAVYLGFLTAYQIDYPLPSILLSALFTFLEMSLMVAVAILFGVFTSSLLAVLLTFSVYLMGHFTRDLVALGSLAESNTIKRITEGLYLFLPDLSRLNLKNQAVYGLQLLPEPVELWSHAGYGLLYTILLLSLATVIFTRREF